MGVLGFALAGCGSSSGSGLEANAYQTEQGAVGADGGVGHHEGHHGRHHQPPQAALDACKDAAESAACTFTAPARDNQSTTVTINGTCRKFGDTLACHPAPPAELIQACADHKVGDACSFTKPQDSATAVSGICQALPHDSNVVLCRPTDADDDHREDHDFEHGEGGHGHHRR